MIKRSQGFTLVELMVVVAVMGVLVAVALPKYGNMIEKANRGATLGNLSALRSAVTIYTAGHTYQPYNLDISDPDFADVIGSVIPMVKSNYPSGASPKGREVEVGTEGPVAQLSGWYYNNHSAWVSINSTALDLEGEVYSTY